MPERKLLPRNRTARIADVRAAGNPVTVELESGVGNCFPGLELDLRNVDRRFFPFLAVDFVNNRVFVAAVDLARAQQELPAGTLLTELQALAALPGRSWEIATLRGEFAGFTGVQTFTLAQLNGAGGAPPRPPDPWTAVRLLRPGTQVTITLRRVSGAAGTRTLTAARASYLTDDGAFAEMFEPGELTQSLCSPWTHDFRDCACYYWASNHPDIAQPALPPGAQPDDPEWTGQADWLRSDRLAAPPPIPPPDQRQRIAGQLRHHEINDRWQELDVVLDGREQRVPYAPLSIGGTALAPAMLERTLRYAAGVEIAVMLEYLAAAFSIDPNAGAPDSELRRNARAARAELLRVAASEMRHLRQVNSLLLDLHTGPGPFRPALGVATLIPGTAGAPGRPVRFRPLTAAVLAEFVAVEAPSLTVDALYGNILATYRRDDAEAQAALVFAVMAEGADHYRTFRVVQEWLGQHPGEEYLRTLQPATAPQLATLQQRYEAVLDLLHRGYVAAIPAGAADIAAARAAMLGPAGIEGACEALAAGGRMPTFVVPADPRFAAVPPP